LHAEAWTPANARLFWRPENASTGTLISVSFSRR
jgi:hypothetical protein